MFSRLLTCVAASTAMVAGLSGCSEQSLRPAVPDTATISIRGGVMGGQQPVTGSTIQLYAVGTSGFQGASKTILTKTVTSDVNGNFSLATAFSCSSATQVYITATGGNATPLGANANLVMMAALGPCTGIGTSTFITINELTTVAAAVGLAPYTAGITSVGSSSGGTYSGDEALALAQAFTLSGEFVSTASGLPPGVGVPSGMTVPASLLYTLGDILAACVNTTGGAAGDVGNTNCGKFFAAAPSSNGTVPTDTFTAMLNIVNHPTANLTSLYGLASSTGPFQPILTSQPTSFAVALTPPAGTVTRTIYPEPDSGFSFLYTLVNNAASTIDMTMYGLADTTMSGDLVAACQRGVTVRVILDQNDEMNVDMAAYTQLNAQAHCSAVWANPAFQVTHEKSLVIDGKTVVILTANLETSSYAGTRDFGLVTNDPVDYAAMEATFNADYGSTTDYAYVPSLGNDLIWSPTTARGSLVSVINSALSTLNVENEEMSDPTVVAALEAACTRGVTTHITMTYSSSYATNFTNLKAAGCLVRTYANSVHVIYIHAKVIIADYGLAAANGYMGSINFSTASEIENRELGLFVHDTGLLGTLNTTLNTDYDGATPY